jgi:peptidyl-prolyl cis-trans isomerase B (cyclophilin B)
LLDNEDGIYARAPTASSQLQEVVADLIRQGVVTPGSEGWRANIPGPPALGLVPGKSYDWLLETPHGTIRIELAPDTAPLHSVNLIYLSAFAYYDGLYFNRVIPGFLVQGGGTTPVGPGARGADYTVPSERSPDLLLDRPGRVAMVKSGTEASSAGQFFITFVPTPWLDGRNTITGRVTGGFEVLTVIETLGSEGGDPVQPIPIIKAWVEEGTARIPQEDAALVELQAYIQSQIAAGGITPASEGWRSQLPTYPELTFTRGRSYLWHLETSLGPITLLFYPGVAPKHVASFMYLAELGYFDGLDFHRVIPRFMAQGGWDPQGGPGYNLPTVTKASVRHDRAGVLSMANTGRPNSEGSGIFITFARTSWLDGKHTIFGTVVDGMETVREIEKRGNRDGRPAESIIIQRTWVTVD